MSAFLRKYNTLLVTGTTAIRIPIVKRAAVDFAVGADWTPAAGDVKIAVDGAAPANVTNLPTAVASGNGAYWEFILTAAELSCKQAIVTVADAATKAVEDQAFIVETFGHASAMYPPDFTDAAALGLSRLDAAISTRLASAGYTAPLDASGTRTAVGLAAANLDTQLSTIAGYIDTEVAAILAAVDTEVAAIKAKTDNLPASPAAVGSAMTLASGAIDSAAVAAAAANKIADHILRRALATALASSDGDTKTFRSLAGAVAKLVDRIVSSGGTLTIYEPDDTTSLGTQTLTTDAAAEPIVEANTV